MERTGGTISEEQKSSDGQFGKALDLSGKEISYTAEQQAEGFKVKGLTSN